MSPLDFETLSPEERLLAEQFVLNLRSLDEACDQAADGTVLAVGESLAMTQGRELIRRSLEVALQKQARALEKKRPLPAVAAARPPRPTAAKNHGRS
jgi:hypothetical protein